MNLGIQIKKLRLQKGISQEVLAKQLRVTAQAVSRWENGITAPDISMLPAIAYYFQVSIDMLFAYHPADLAGALDDTFQSYFEALRTDDFKAKEILSDALQRFPGNEHLELLQLYHLKGKENLERRKELCKRLSASCQPTVRHEALCALAATYYRNGEDAALRDVLAELPECDETKLSLSARFLKGQESLDAAQRQKSGSLATLVEMLQIISDRYRESGKYKESQAVLTVAREVLEAFREDVPFQYPKGDRPVQTYCQFSKEREIIQQRLADVEADAQASGV